MAKWAEDHGYGEEVLDRLILDAMNDPSNPIITDLNDPRIGIYDFDGDGFSETYVYPEPTWQQPHDWDESPWFMPDDPLRPRDYTGLRDPLGEAGEWFKDRWRDFSNGMESAMRRLGREMEEGGRWVRDLFRWPFGPRDPLVLDLNLNGVALTELASSDAHFDFDMDGFAERTGWISQGDALLVRDLNGNGVIDNGGELFGSATEDGFTTLATFDLNADGRISSADAVWSDLRLWKDANQDGVTQAGEIVTLASQAVASIDLAAAESRESRAGNPILFDGGFTLTNGLQGEAVAVAFITDQVNTIFQLPEGFEYDPEVFSLPNLRGYGLVPDLWIAMSLDPTLKAIVKDLIADASSFTSLQDVVGEYFVMALGGFGGGIFYPHSYDMQTFDHMLARWAGVDTGDEERVQAENIAEKFMNQQADHAYGNPFFYQAFEKFSTGIAVRFYAQVVGLNEHAVFFRIVEAFRTAAAPANGPHYSEAELAAILAPARALFDSPPVVDPDLQIFGLLEYDFATDSISGDVAGFIDDQLQSYDFDPLEPWEGYAEWYLERKALLEAIDPDGLVLDERHRAYTHNHDLAILDGPNAVYNEIVGGSGNDVLVGDPSGTLVKTDLLVGGAGNDTLQGGQGDDTYVFSDGSGADIVFDTVGNNEIAFQDSLVSTLARYSFANGNWQDLLISFAGRAETVTVIGYFSSNGSPTLERITFPDGLQASGRPIRDGVFASLATSGDDAITSFPLATTLVGLAGNDTLTGRGGDDILIGGVGNDLLSGGGGNDVYRFAPGDGHDIVQEYSNGFNGWGGTDTIEFGADIDPADIVVTQADYGWDLVLTRTGTGDSITLDGTVNGANARIEQVRFADGTVWTHADMMAMAVAATAGNDNIWGDPSAETLSGGAGNDVIDARAGNDLLIGGTGNDTLYGSGGDDTYFFARGDGDDLIREYVNGFSGRGGTDTIEFSADIAPADILVSQADYGWDLVLTIAGTTDRITIDSGLGGGSDYRVEQVRFADGTLWGWSELVGRSIGATTGNDTIAGDGNSNILGGLAGNDLLDGRQGDDVLTGGPGNDVLAGSAGNDTYVFGRGDGADVIRDYIASSSGSGGFDTIELADGIAPEDVLVTSVDWGWDLLLAISGTSDSITLDSDVQDSKYRIEQVVFADGTIWTHADLMAMATVATAGDDTIRGSYDAESLSGAGGNDVIDGRAGNDVIAGGSGNDTLYGSGGDDRYLYARGDGHDVVRDYVDAFSGWGGFDRVELASGIAPDDVTVGKADNGGSYVLYIDGGTGSITLTGAVSWGANYDIEEVRFAGGTIWVKQDLEARAVSSTNAADALNGTAAANSLRGLGGNDRLVGGEGSDQMKGDGGDDVLIGDLAGFDAVVSGSSLLVNGGFEQAGTIISTGSWGNWNSTMTGWVRSNSHNYEQVKSGEGGIWASEGSYWLDLEGGSGAGSNMIISQTVSGLAAGQPMILMFDHANRVNSPSGAFEVWWNGVLVMTVPATGKAMITDRLELLAVAGDNVLTFKGIGANDSTGASLDNVRLFATVPAVAGPDSLDGGEGNDLIDGGGAADLLTGGAGADVFRFDWGDSGLGAGADRIADFLSGADRIDLSAIDADAGVAGNQAFAFIGASAFGGVAGQLRFASAGADTWLEADTDGDGDADFQIALSGTVAPVAGDFIL